MRDCRAFACPQVSREGWLAAPIAIAHARGAVELVLDREHAAVAERSDGMTELIERWRPRTPDFDTVWDVAFGRVLRALESPELDPIDALAELALHLAARGEPGQWRAELASRRRLLWDRRWLLPAARTLAIDSDGAVASIVLDGARRVELAHDTVGWRCEDPSGVERMYEVGGERSLVLLPGHAVPEDMIVEDSFHSIFEFPPVTPAVAAPFAEALRLIAAHAPDYLVWVHDAVHSVLVCRCDHSRTRSSSWMHAPGAILVSSTDDPVTIAEMLIHEASHQYFHLLGRLGAVDDGSDTQSYYSPAVQRGRTLPRILIGYHAFANVLLFYRALERARPRDPQIRAMASRMRNDVAELEQPLRGNPALTALGRDLCEPLMERVAEGP